MEKKEIQNAYNKLFQYWREYCGSTDREKNRIEDSVRMYGETLSGELYVSLNEGSASGLFRPAFFQGDLERSISILKKLLDE